MHFAQIDIFLQKKTTPLKIDTFQKQKILFSEN